jgi:hypothetical protein
MSFMSNLSSSELSRCSVVSKLRASKSRPDESARLRAVHTGRWRDTKQKHLRVDV